MTGSITDPIFTVQETAEEAIKRNRDLYVSGIIGLNDFTFRVGVILKDHPDERPAS